MKKLAHLLLTLAVVAALGWALWRGFHSSPNGKKEEPEAAAAGEEKEEHEDFTVTLEKEKWKALDFEMAEPVKTELVPHRVAFGRVLDPTALVTLDGDLAAAEAALTASQAENERNQKLFAAGENTSRKAVETAQAQFRSDEIKLASLRRAALLQWGASFASGDTAARHAMAEALVHGDSGLVRVDLLPGDILTETPKAARLAVLGREQQPIVTSFISPAADTDARTQAQGFILRVDKPPFPLRPGMSLTAWLELNEKPRAGFELPRSAILRHDGRTWVFVQEEEEKFVRKPVTLDTPLGEDKGWFVATDGGIKADDLLVLAGAEVLLSEEMKAAGGSAEEP